MVTCLEVFTRRSGHIVRFGTFAALATLIAAMPAPALAQEFTPAQLECNTLASSQADDSLPEGSIKVEFTLLDFEKAIPACETALAEDETNARIQFQLGRSYDRAGNYEKALEHYRLASDGGYAAAMRAIGILYANGDGVEQNDLTAIEWHEKAVEAGSMSAVVDVGWFYYSGVGVELDQEKAIGMFEEAAEAGIGYAMTMLAWAYENGSGVELDETKAYDYYKQAAEAGDSGGMYNLGLIYRDGKFGYDFDDAAAFGWFQQAADLGNVEAMVAVAQGYADGVGIDQSDEKAAEWHGKAAALALPETAYTVAGNYEFGTNGYLIDYEQAAVWYRLAADKDHTDAVWALGRLYLEEPSLPDSGEAEALLEKSFELGGGYYGYYTASLYEGRGEFDKALDWYERSSDDGDTYSMVRAGALYETGNVVDQDSAKAEELFDRAAEGNDPYTLLSIGYAYYYGDETGDTYTANLEKALEWMQRAAEAGSEEAADVALDIEAEIAGLATTTDEPDDIEVPDENDTTTPPDEDDTTPPSDGEGKDKEKDRGADETTTPPEDDGSDKGKDKG